MPAMIIWMVVLTISVCAMIFSAALGDASIHMAMTGLVSLGIALMAIRENMQLRAANASRNAVSASTARFMGLVWLWGALSLLITYFFILTWNEWWQFFLGFAAAGVLCLLMATAIERDEQSGRKDDTMLTLTRYMAYGQLLGMMITIAGLAIDPDKRFGNVDVPDWAANNIFMFGAIALAAITVHALYYDKQPAE